MSTIIIKELLSGYLGIIISMMKVLIPLMIILELLIVYNIMEKLAKKLTFLTKLLRIGKESIFPLIVGVIAGVTFGAGALLEINNRSPIPPRDLQIIGVLIFICHGIIETTLIFAVVGANVWIISIGRLLIAVAVAAIVARILPSGSKKEGELLPHREKMDD